MIEYLIKSIICSAVLYFSFILLLKKTRNYQLNRFFLLFSVFFVLSVPALNFSLDSLLSSQIIKSEAIYNSISTINSFSNDTELIDKTALQKGINFIDILLIIYFLVSLALLARYFRNFFNLNVLKGSSNFTVYNGHKIYLLDQTVNPFSFFGSIYLSKEKFNNETIDHDLIQHEIAHKKQLHSLDIIIIELLQALFWFNPFILLFKSLIKANHEYLADEFVVKAGSSNKDYSNKILKYTFRNKTLSLASGFNYSLIKSRIIMLSKYKQKKRFAYQTILFFPVIVLLFATTAFTTINGTFQNVFNINPTESCVIEYYGDKDEGGHIINGNKDELFSNMNEKYYISQEPISGSFSDNNEKTEIKLANYRFKEIKGEVFIDNKKVGTVQKDDIIILHHEKRIDVYSKNRVTIK